MQTNLDRVTITGPDDSIAPSELVKLSQRFPFVEWGILVSASQVGSSRFPTFDWIRELQTMTTGRGMRLSLHLCGRWVRRLLVGQNEIPSFIFDGFDRVQLNFHAERAECQPRPFANALRALAPRQFIFQADGASGNAHLQAAQENEVANCVALFDVSGGAGILPKDWPEPIYMTDPDYYAYHGYAGGLGPDNLEREIPRIIAAARGAPIWIDMETRVRSNDDQQFDLHKVYRCLGIAAPFVDASPLSAAAHEAPAE